MCRRRTAVGAAVVLGVLLLAAPNALAAGETKVSKSIGSKVTCVDESLANNLFNCTIRDTKDDGHDAAMEYRGIGPDGRRTSSQYYKNTKGPFTNYSPAVIKFNCKYKLEFRAVTPRLFDSHGRWQILNGKAGKPGC